MKTRRDNFPKSVLSYYVKLYSKTMEKIGTTEKGNLVAKATQSWLKLSSKKKQLIITKYNIQQLKLKKQFAEKLRKIPVNQEECVNESIEENSKCISINDSSVIEDFDTVEIENSKRTIQEINDVSQRISLNGSFMKTSHQNIHETNGANPVIPEEQRLSLNIPENYNGSVISQHPALLLEPMPPQFRSNKEFYYLINNNSENIIEWEKLTRAERGRYDRAATRIRRNYINSYTNFLESLTPEELYSHYKKVTES